MAILLGVLAFLLAATATALGVRLRTTSRGVARLRQRIATLEQEVERTEATTSRLLASITHELRTPLTAILGYQELLADGLYGDMDARCHDAVARIGDAGAQLLRLVDGVLELARLDAGRLELALAPVSLDELLTRAADAARSDARDRGVTLETDIPAGLPTIISDPDRLARALELSITEAIRASAGTALRISARLEAEAAVTIEIAGTGLAADAYAPDRILGELHGPGDEGTPDNRAAFRLSVAHRLACLLGGDLALEPAAGRTTLRLHITEAPQPRRAAAH